MAVNNSLNMLLGYPHHCEDVWHDYITATPAEVARVLARFRGEREFDSSPKGHFDRFM